MLSVSAPKGRRGERGDEDAGGVVVAAGFDTAGRLRGADWCDGRA